MDIQGYADADRSGLHIKIVFRVDSSLQIGTGHVMRCLALADVLRGKGAQCSFICREHEGNLIEFIRSKGYVTHALPVAPAGDQCAKSPSQDHATPGLAHRQWLGSTQDQDAKACAPILSEQHPDWLIVDHYALDARWEKAMRPYCRQLMVIDDLADRQHDCDLLLDQNLGRTEQDYAGLIKPETKPLIGPRYALLRPEFAQWREQSLARRSAPQLKSLLVTMGGVDQANATGQVLDALKACQLPADLQITIVMGPNSPWLAQVQVQASNMPWPTQVLSGVSSMAELMANSDFAIGAAGSTSWERCCLGLPTIMYALADNQLSNCRMLSQAGAAIAMGVPSQMSADEQAQRLAEALAQYQTGAAEMVTIAVRLCDGQGCSRIVDIMVRGGQ